MELKPAPIGEIAPKPALKPKASNVKKTAKAPKKADNSDTQDDDLKTAQSDEDNVVSLDHFRKK